MTIFVGLHCTLSHAVTHFLLTVIVYISKQTSFSWLHRYMLPLLRGLHWSRTGFPPAFQPKRWKEWQCLCDAMRRLAGLRGTFALTGSMLTTHTFHTVTGSSHKDRVSQTLAYLRTQRWSFAQENVPRGLVGFQLPSIPHASCSNVLEKGSHQASSFLGGRKGFRRKKKGLYLSNLHTVFTFVHFNVALDNSTLLDGSPWWQKAF